eukprot:5122571-Amphidinium_carterae.1
MMPWNRVAPDPSPGHEGRVTPGIPARAKTGLVPPAGRGHTEDEQRAHRGTDRSQNLPGGPPPCANDVASVLEMQLAAVGSLPPPRRHLKLHPSQ